MPLFDFECKTCGHVFEELIFDSDERPPCQKCNSSETRSRVSAPSPLHSNPFPYKTSGKPMPPMPANLNRTCPNAGSCSASATIGGSSASSGG